MAHTYTNRADNRSPTWLNDAGFIALCLVYALANEYVIQTTLTNSHTQNHSLTPLLVPHILFSIYCPAKYTGIHARTLSGASRSAAAVQLHIVSRKRFASPHTNKRLFVGSFVSVSNLISVFISLTHHHFHFNFR